MQNKYSQLTSQEIEHIFAKDVLGYYIKSFTIHCESCYEPQEIQRWMYGNLDNCQTHFRVKNPKWKIGLALKPLTDFNHAMLGVEKLIDKHCFELKYDIEENSWYCALVLWAENWLVDCYADTPQEAIVEACISIVRPDLFEGDDPRKIK